MRVLLTNNTLAWRGGTELYLLDVARELKRLGHEPVAYSPHLKDVAEHFRAAGIPVVANLAVLPFRPDVIHGQHHVETMTIAFEEVDRAVVDEECDGFVRIHHARGRMLGCTVVSSRAGEMIGLAAYALKHGVRLGGLGSVIYPYPTLTNAFRAAGDVFGRSRLTPRVRALLKQYFRLL